MNQARVEETGIPMPKLIEVCKLDGKWAIVSDYIEGKTLQQLMDENPAKTEEYLDLFVDIQMSILAKTCPMLNKLKDKMQGKISQTDLDATTRYDLHTRLAGMHTHNKVCHGDFRPSNIIIGNDGVNYVIDWAHVTQGNGAADAAERIFFSASEAIRSLPISISICSAKRPIPQSSMFRNGFLS